VVPFAVELEMNTTGLDRLSVQPLRDLSAFEQLDGSLLEHPGPDPRLDILAASVLEHDRLDAGAMQQGRENEPGWSGTDDRDLST
jgi:hypothetical protein